MTRKNLFYTILAFMVGVSVWLYNVNKELQQTQQVIREQRPSLAVQSQKYIKEEPPKDTKNTKDLRRAQHLAETQSLKATLAAETQSLNQKRVVLRNLESSRRALGLSNIIAQVQQGNEIQRFQEELNSYDRLESEIASRVAGTLNSQKTALEAARLSLDEAIRRQEQAVELIKQQLSDLQIMLLDISTKEKRNEEFREQLSTLEEELANLRQQRIDLSISALEFERALQTEKEQVFAEINENRLSIKDEIMSRREASAIRQQEEAQAQVDMSSLLSKISQSRIEMIEQSRKVKDLEQEVKLREQEQILLE